MNYWKLVEGLSKEFLEEGRVRYNRLNVVLRFICTIIFIPGRIAFFFARLAFWFVWFAFKAISAPVDYLQNWLKKQKEETNKATQVVLYLVCMPMIFYMQFVIAMLSYVFFIQWFGLMLSAYILTLGAVRWQPFVNEATFEPIPEPVVVTAAEE